MKLISYNVNGIRAALKKGLTDFIRESNPDIVGFQEIKAQIEDVPKEEFEALGYKTYWFIAEKKGYSGVGIISKTEPLKVDYGYGNPQFDAEGRVIIAYYPDFVVINAYFPSGTTGDVRQAIKMEFLEDFYSFIQEFTKTNPKTIVMGDYNIAHQAIDIHNPVGNKNSSGFLPEERAWMTKWFEHGMIDSFRHLHPTEKNAYTWWTFRSNARAQNKGWRIDYISISDVMKPNLSSANIYPQVVQSDHCPIDVVLG